MKTVVTSVLKTLSICFVAALLLATSASHAGPGGVDAGLKVWLQSDGGLSVGSSGEILRWGDGSGQSNDATYNSQNSYGELPPMFVASNPAIAGQPSIRFNNQNALELDLTFLTGSDYTVFVVNARDRFGLANFYIAGDRILDNGNLVLGYEQTALLRQAHFNNDLDGITEGYSGTPVWSIDTFRFSQLSGRDLFHNGHPLASDDNFQPLVANTGTTLGHFRALPQFWFHGDLAEVVVYDRALSSEERLQVELALASRYDRDLSIEDYVPCNGAWSNHGNYVSTLARVASEFRKAGLLRGSEAAQIVSAGAASSCGATPAP